MFNQLGAEARGCGPAVAAAPRLVICHAGANTCLSCHFTSPQNANPIHHHCPLPSPLHLLSNIRAVPLHLTAQQSDPSDSSDVAVESDPQFALLHSSLFHRSLHSPLLRIATPPPFLVGPPLRSSPGSMYTSLLLPIGSWGGGGSTLTAPVQACEQSASFCVARLRL